MVNNLEDSVNSNNPLNPQENPNFIVNAQSKQTWNGAYCIQEGPWLCLGLGPFPSGPTLCSEVCNSKDSSLEISRPEQTRFVQQVGQLYINAAKSSCNINLGAMSAQSTQSWLLIIIPHYSESPITQTLNKSSFSLETFLQLISLYSFGCEKHTNKQTKQKQYQNNSKKKKVHFSPIITIYSFFKIFLKICQLS